ncbi:50S ribosomal protein L35 [Kroppenstedtia eburnea]|jgi:large subunit ribosomal protein L35|uniref:Large ribosomal subunit protein bL35 n=2 Tax=Kroppenstedtia TaxID=1274351 RepID=A0A1N7LVU3_9BACL|nr:MULTISPECIES: 50S ribosomal protein L35 [Kroppenstedtia]EGK06858.1 50S ribosomal protein L35 [Desmospora sp. 8437]QKI81673.1 50S ribosomal protein L35 [Kroppenstedtia eburnea]GGA52790.1 50S ribosomal protein L35 [Kroppenstedtia guangzhouensis]SIS77937.1 LSU ribosomal protein L35P [Kroppenstedtia eburnea]
MPKMKTRRAAAKRFNKTGTGKVKRNHAYMNHMLEHKPKSAKRKLRKSTTMSKSDVKRIKQLIAYK